MRSTTRRRPDVYTVQLVLDLKGPLDAAVLEAAVQARGGAPRAACGRLPA